MWKKVKITAPYWIRISLFLCYTHSTPLEPYTKKEATVLNENGVYSWLDPNKWSKYLQQVEYSNKKDEINTDYYNN